MPPQGMGGFRSPLGKPSAQTQKTARGLFPLTQVRFRRLAFSDEWGQQPTQTQKKHPHRGCITFPNARRLTFFAGLPRDLRACPPHEAST